MEMEGTETNEEVINYEKSKDYWSNIEPTNCGMLGNLLQVSLPGKLNSHQISFLLLIA
jgi:hypothetical protein